MDGVPIPTTEPVLGPNYREWKVRSDATQTCPEDWAKRYPLVTGENGRKTRRGDPSVPRISPSPSPSPREHQKGYTSVREVDGKTQIELEYEGEVWTLDLEAMSKRSGIAKALILRRISKGYPVELLFDPDGGRKLSIERRGRPLTFRGKTQGMCEWARELGIKRVTIRQRLRYGWSVERALSEPVRSRRKRVPPDELSGGS